MINRLPKYFLLSALVVTLPLFSSCDKMKKGGGGNAATAGQVAYEINGKKFSLDDVVKNNMGSFYELEKKKADMIQDLAQAAFLDDFFGDLSKKENKSKDEVQKAYVAANVKVSDEEVAATLQRVGNHPNLASMTDDQKKKTVRDYLEQTKSSQVLKDLVDKAIKDKKLVIAYQAPEEPRYPLSIVADEIHRFGPGPDDINPVAPNGCKGDDCAVTIVEYSEFQCPFCSRILPTAKQILEKYKGKIRWVVRNFPLDFHPNARPAAIAAACAAQQNKYWQLYEVLFANQRTLEKENIVTYASQVGLDMNKFNACFNAPEAINKKIDEQMKFGQSVGVSGTPAFFINGRKISGALPYESFEKIIDEELAAKK